VATVTFISKQRWLFLNLLPSGHLFSNSLTSAVCQCCLCSMGSLPSCPEHRWKWEVATSLGDPIRLPRLWTMENHGPVLVSGVSRDRNRWHPATQGTWLGKRTKRNHLKTYTGSSQSPMITGWAVTRWTKIITWKSLGVEDTMLRTLTFPLPGDSSKTKPLLSITGQKSLNYWIKQDLKMASLNIHSFPPLAVRGWSGDQILESCISPLFSYGMIGWPDLFTCKEMQQDFTGVKLLPTRTCSGK
jgi:hypothetical protein